MDQVSIGAKAHARTPHLPARAARDASLPPRLTFEWLLAELVSGGLVAAEAARQVKPPPAAKGAALPHPLVMAAAQDWPDRRNPQSRLTLEVLTQWLAHRVHLPYERIDPLSLNVGRLTETVSYAYASRAGILPIKVTPQAIVFAVKDPLNTEWMSELEPALKVPLKAACANPQDIDRYLVEFYAIARSVRLSGQERADSGPTGLQNLEQLTELTRANKQLTAEDRHVVAIVDWLLQYAFDSRASDIHLEPRRDTGNVRFRIDGVLHQVYQFPSAVTPSIVARLKILGRLDIAEKRRPQDGRIRTRSPDGREIELRLSSMPTAFGEKLVLRIFNPDVLVRDFHRLGFSGDETRAWNTMISQPHGIVLVTGPTGSGKTTTLYSSLKQLATEDVNVCTIEDPIELIDGSFNQMQVQPNIDLTFADGVRALLRQDPDIIMIGEIRDLETAEVAVQAALTGHLVLSTLHTNDSPSAVTRLLELGLPAYLIRATLIGTLAQRLLRTLCPHCKAPMTMDGAQWQELGASPVPRGTPHRPVGCLECRETGYLGRTGVYELMALTPALRAAIGSNADLAELRKLAQRDGMRPLRLAGAEKVAAGVTSVSEVLSLTPDPRQEH
jgi:general secretion pathway protein E